MIDEDLEYLRRTLNNRRNIWNGVCQLGMATFRVSTRSKAGICLCDLDWRSYLAIDVVTAARKS